MDIEGDKVQANSNDNIFNKIIAENLQNIEKKDHHPGTVCL
jgi:hypothetical protein